MERKELKLVFGNLDGNMDPALLGDYLMLFRAVYVAALSALKDWDIDDIMDSQDQVGKVVRAYIQKLSIPQINSLFKKNMGDRNLLTSNISKQSPLEIVLLGVLVPLAVAVIISGGKFKGPGGFEVEISRPLGDGIRRLRDALKPSKRTHVGYGIKTTKVKLSKDEYSELMKYDPASKNQGGFQRFLIGLQFRIKKQTKEIELSDSDVDMIIKHGSEPKKGGWQKSIYRIFGKHFNLKSEP